MYKIKITLTSDLCTGSGQGFSSSIDTDVCYDEFGFPYIPARRLKGCLREAAEYIESPNINEIFGIANDNKGGSLKIYTARIGGYDEIVREFHEKGFEFNQTDILDLFTYTKSQTAIENDRAQENSLRFTRLVKQYSPIDGNPLIFFADCEIDESYKESFGRVCKALRNIGMNRTRGLGAVKCELAEINRNEHSTPKYYDDNKKYTLKYRVYLKSPLMLPNTLNDQSLTYIPGTAVLGSLASSYLRENQHGTEFDDIFLKNNVIFSNLYIENAVPAPLFMIKLKTNGILTTNFTKDKLNVEHKDDTPKPFRDKYIDSNFREVKVLTESVYHHTKKETEVLYTQNFISARQYFNGEIRGGGNYIGVIESLLKKYPLKFGRSKTAEYSGCDILEIAVSETESPENIKISDGDNIIVALESDLLLLDDTGNYTTECNCVAKAIADALSLIMRENALHRAKTILEYKTIAGYNAVWNAQKTHIRALSSGSVICFRHNGLPCVLPEYFSVGEKQSEGFGKCRIYKESDLPVKIETNLIPKENKKTISYENENLKNISALIHKGADTEKLRITAIQFMNDNSGELRRLNAAFVGRVSLMIRQSADFTDLQNRVDSIKSENKRKSINDLIKKAGLTEKTYKEFLTLVFTLAKYRLKVEGGAAENDDE